MSARKLKPGESPKDALIEVYTKIVAAIDAGEVLTERFDKASVAVSLSMHLAMLQALQDRGDYELMAEICARSERIMKAWGWSMDEEEEPPDETPPTIQ